MDLQELKPILDLLNLQEERLVDKINEVHGDVIFVRDELKKLNGTVRDHELIIAKNLPHTVLHCSQTDAIQEIKKAILIEDTEDLIRKRRKEEERNRKIIMMMFAGVMISFFVGIGSFFIGYGNSKTNIITKEQNDTTITQGEQIKRDLSIIKTQVIKNTIRIDSLKL